ncbi:MAG: hypothetical protein L7F78_14395 [Syntrophales bacterium LBB04]|nr:hypothetical protein [Syntrophales bacterium LBB04]
MNLFAEIRELLLRNWPLKLIALILAILLRLFVVGDKVVERFIPDVQLEFRNLAADLEIGDLSRQRFDVVLMVPRDKQIQPSEIAVLVDLANRPSGTHQIQLSPSKVAVPDGVEVLRVNPALLDVSLRKRQK